jgi:hypothetical protein
MAYGSQHVKFSTPLREESRVASRFLISNKGQGIFTLARRFSPSNRFRMVQLSAFAPCISFPCPLLEVKNDI